MHEILRNLAPGSKVLDLGSKLGSFHSGAYPLLVIRLDLESPAVPGSHFVRADAANLPFPDFTFHAVIANHSLEHIAKLPEALNEIGRVLAKGSALYVAVPDASTFSDRLYRWLAHGGGHVNAFTSMRETAARIAMATGLELNAGRQLLSSFSFANRNNERWSRRIALLGWGDERFLACLSFACRSMDKRFRTRLSHYGWAFYFGSVGETVPSEVWTNVCVRCGSAHPEPILREHPSFQPVIFFPARYKCPDCGASNLFTGDGE